MTSASEQTETMSPCAPSSSLKTRFRSSARCDDVMFVSAWAQLQLHTILPAATELYCQIMPTIVLLNNRCKPFLGKCRPIPGIQLIMPPYNIACATMRAVLIDECTLLAHKPASYSHCGDICKCYVLMHTQLPAFCRQSSQTTTFRCIMMTCQSGDSLGS